MIKPMVTDSDDEPALQEASRLHVYDVSKKARESATERFGVVSHDNIEDAVRDATVVVCAVKPQNADTVFQQIRNVVTPNAMLVSILAGKPMSYFHEMSGFSKIVRAMPNTPAMIGEGITVWTAAGELSKEEMIMTKKILCCFGEEIYVQVPPPVLTC